MYVAKQWMFLQSSTGLGRKSNIDMSTRLHILKIKRAQAQILSKGYSFLLQN